MREEKNRQSIENAREMPQCDARNSHLLNITNKTIIKKMILKNVSGSNTHYRQDKKRREIEN